VIEQDDDAFQTPARNGMLSDYPPSRVEQQVCAISRNSPVDDLCAALDAADWLLGRARSIHQIATQKAIEWIDHNGEFSIGDQQYSVGVNTTVRCVNTRQCGHRLLECLNGDLDGFFDLLVAQPFKSGSARRVLPDPAYRDLFVTKRASRLVSGVPDRVLKQNPGGFTR
jgi:hypothetical protein